MASFSEHRPPIGQTGAAKEGTPLKVLMAPVNISGMPLVLVNGLRANGVDARLLQYVRDGKSGHAFGYDSDIKIDLTGRPAGEVRFETVRRCIDDGYDIFHFWLRTLVFGPRYTGLIGADLPLIKLYGRKIVYRFTGMDLRDPKFDLEHNPHSPFRHGFVAAGKDDEPVRRAYIDLLRCHVDQFVVQDPEMGQYMPDARIIPRALPLDDWPLVGVEPNDRPLIVHGPSNPVVKGTKFVLAACEELQAEGLSFDLKLVSGMTHAEAVSWYRRADIVIDQLLIGAYGVLTMEAMALGKPVICYVRDDLFRPVYGELPIVNANPDNIKDRIRQLVKDFEMRREFSARGRAFVEEHHDANRVSLELKDLYGEVMARPQKMPTSGADIAFIGRQYGAIERELTRQRALTRQRQRHLDSTVQKLNEARQELSVARKEVALARKDAERARRTLERRRLANQVRGGVGVAAKFARKLIPWSK